MTATDYQIIRTQYTVLSQMEERTEIEEKRYVYLDKIITFTELYKTATAMGNKNPMKNYLVKDAYERMNKAREEFMSVKNPTV